MRRAMRIRTRFSSLETSPVEVKSAHEGYKTGFGRGKKRVRKRVALRMCLVLNSLSTVNCANCKLRISWKLCLIGLHF